MKNGEFQQHKRKRRANNPSFSYVLFKIVEVFFDFDIIV